MFGGKTGPFSAPLSALTWRFVDDWIAVPGTGPSGRYQARMIYDTARGVYVLYGGWDSTSSFGNAVDETWENVFGTWTQASPANTPGGLWKHSMCFDPTRNVTVLFGGATTGTSAPLSDTWEYNGITWTQITTAGTPGPREDATMCFDASINRCVLFGGRDPGVGTTNSLWLYNGNQWQQLPQVGSWPSARTGMEMVHDPARSVCIMTGGIDNLSNNLFDTWEFNGVTASWSQLPINGSPANGPTGGDFGMVFVAPRRLAVRYGGRNNGSETWKYGAEDTQYGVGCAGSNGVPTLDAPEPPRLGDSYLLQMANTNPQVPVAAMVLSLTQTPATSLNAIGMTGCSAYVTPDFIATAAVGAANVANWSGQIPNNANLLGVSLFAQGLVLDQGVNPAWLVVSNGHQGLIGY